MKAFFFYLNSDIRRSVVRGELACPGANYMLFGSDLLPGEGIEVRHNLDSATAPSIWAFRWGWLMAQGIKLIRGSSGDFQTVFQERRRANQADVIVSTVDNVGVPLVFLSALGLIRRPILYISIGLPERMQTLPRLTRAFYRLLYRRIPAFATYGWDEAVRLREWLGLPPDSPRVQFIPFGVDHLAFQPPPETKPEVEVLSVGADMQRDFNTLLQVAADMPSASFRIITSERHAKSFVAIPPNVEVLTHVPFPDISRHLASARIVALPCHENSYSSGTTTLLQAMAMGKPVVVSRTGATANGYALSDNLNCRLVAPGSASALAAALGELLAAPAARVRLGVAARQTIESHLTWNHYVARLAKLIHSLASP